MKNSWDLNEDLSDEIRKLLPWDQFVIDNPDKHDRSRLHHVDRWAKVLSMARKTCKNASQSTVAEFGCAQGNVSLTLAEEGYRVYAIDINPSYIEWSKRKYEKGIIQWVTGNIETLEFPFPPLDVAILGEIITTCAHPDAIIKKVMSYLRPGGFLIITFPNASRIATPLPTWKEIQRSGTGNALEQNQFGLQHLFKLPLPELREMVSPHARLVESAYCGSTCLINKYTQRLIRLIPISLLESMIRMQARIPILNRKTCNSSCVVLQKNVTVTEPGKIE